MDGAQKFQSITLKSLLSFGPSGQRLDLQPLNVLIGQNASGKSNLIQAIRLFRSMSGSLAGEVYSGGGVREFIYKGGEATQAELAAEVLDTNENDVVRHSIEFVEERQKLSIVSEEIASLRGLDLARDIPEYYYQLRGGKPSIFGRSQNFRTPVRDINGMDRFLNWATVGDLSKIDYSNSIVSQRNDPSLFPPISHLFETYRAIRVYSQFDMQGPNSLRVPQRPDLSEDFLEESGRNLGFVINDLTHRNVLPEIDRRMQIVNQDIERISSRISGGTVQTYVHERELREPIPATRLSDGTLRYLCLLTVLLHPEPPPLICIEEPETGLHPDALSSVAELLVEASKRTQLVVTTHSEILVSALSCIPEAIVVCERTSDGTTLTRLSPDDLSTWLERYSLGDLWLKGEIGGTRW